MFLYRKIFVMNEMSLHVWGFVLFIIEPIKTKFNRQSSKRLNLL